jgi:hypothetical protein
MAEIISMCVTRLLSEDRAGVAVRVLDGSRENLPERAPRRLEEVTASLDSRSTSYQIREAQPVLGDVYIHDSMSCSAPLALESQSNPPDRRSLEK